MNVLDCLESMVSVCECECVNVLDCLESIVCVSHPRVIKFHSSSQKMVAHTYSILYSVLRNDLWREIHLGSSL